MSKNRLIEEYSDLNKEDFIKGFNSDKDMQEDIAMLDVTNTIRPYMQLVEFRERVNAIDVCEHNEDEIHQINDELDKVEQVAFKRMFNIMVDSNFEVDCYGIPKLLCIEQILEEGAKDFKLDDDIIDGMRNYLDEGLKAENDFTEYTEEEKDAYIEYMTSFVENETSYLFNIIGSLLGHTFQSALKLISIYAKRSILVKESKKKGKKYFSNADLDLMDELEHYWMDTMPNCPSTKQPYYRQTYFNYLAEKYGKTFKGVEALEKRNRPKYFKPKK